jgi:hypothetical protein
VATASSDKGISLERRLWQALAITYDLAPLLVRREVVPMASTLITRGRGRGAGVGRPLPPTPAPHKGKAAGGPRFCHARERDRLFRRTEVPEGAPPGSNLSCHS